MPSTAADQVCFAVATARAFEAKAKSMEPDQGPDTGDVLGDFAEDPTDDKLKSFIQGLNQDEQTDLIAPTWLGKGGETGDEWPTGRDEAKLARTDDMVEYHTMVPLLGDDLEEGLSKPGYSCEEIESWRSSARARL